MPALNAASWPELRSLAGSVLVVVAGSTRTSTIPGISIAGPSPEGTLLTPTLDVEYLVAGAPASAPFVPVAPNGVPTPAVITRAILEGVRRPAVVVDAGCYLAPRVPHVRLPSARVGGRVDAERAFPPGTSSRLFSEAELLGRQLARVAPSLVVGETIPGGTTTAAAILEALGVRAVDLVSSSSPRNPRELKRRVVAAAVARARGRGTLWEVLDEVGDPVHVAMAGIACGALGEGSRVFLAGGTQMAAVVAVMLRACGRVPHGILTTRWIVEDSSSSIDKLVEQVAPGLPIVYAPVSFADAPFEGLRLYEMGFAKEGVAAGAAIIVGLAHGLSVEEVKRLVYEEYRRLTEASKTKQ